MRYWRNCECGGVQWRIDWFSDDKLLFVSDVYYCPDCGAYDVITRRFSHPGEVDAALQVKYREWLNGPIKRNVP